MGWSARAALLGVCGCSLIATRAPSADFEANPGVVPPDCSQSNLPAGVDMLLVVGAALGAVGLADDSTAPDAAGAPPRTSADRSSEKVVAAAFGGLAVLSAYSMVRGFQRSSACRDVTRATGNATYGELDWLTPIVVVLTIGAYALATSGGDADRCSPGAVHTARCNDGIDSCSLVRSGTCSHHRGVAMWL